MCPNWCEGELTVKGTKAELAKFREAVTSDCPVKTEPEEVLDRITLKPDPDISYLDANKIIPYPKEYADADKRGAKLFAEAMDKQSKFLDTCERKPIGLPYDGACFTIPTWKVS